MRKILITGGSGFIGTNLIEDLLRDNQNEFLNLDINEPKIKAHYSSWKNVDIRDKKELITIMLDFNPTEIIHLAARTDLNGKTIENYNTNIVGVENLLEAIQKLKNINRVIFTSSMYVCEPGYIPQNFEDYKPHTIYGESKVLTEEIIKKANLQYTYSIIRPTSIWGPYFGEPYKNFFDIVLSKKYFHMGSKACDKTYGYIDNTVYQINSLLKASVKDVNNKTFYIGDSPAYNISEWADEIANHKNIRIPKIPFFIFRCVAYIGDVLKLMGVNFPMTSFRLKNMTTDNVHDLGLIRELAPKLPVSREDGVKKTVMWINSIKK